jgi:hypothetical protein
MTLVDATKCRVTELNGYPEILGYIRRLVFVSIWDYPKVLYTRKGRLKRSCAALESTE